MKYVADYLNNITNCLGWALAKFYFTSKSKSLKYCNFLWLNIKMKQLHNKNSSRKDKNTVSITLLFGYGHITKFLYQVKIITAL